MPAPISGITISKLTADHYETPSTGSAVIGNSTPRLSWRFDSPVDSGVSDWTQHSYEIRIKRGSKTEEYAVESEQSILVEWPSTPLTSRETATVNVRAYGNDGSVTPWAELNIEVALLERSEWQAQVISCTASAHNKESTKRPFYVRRSFTLDNDARHARLYVTALGLYEIEINGKRVGDHFFAPGWQSYNHHLNYQSFDVSTLLRKGENVIGGYVGEGWYAGSLGFGGGRRNIYGDRIGLMAQLEVGGQVVAKTDSDWEWSFGPIISSEIYHGELYDAREERIRWSMPGSSTESDWSPVEVIASPKARLISPESPPVRQTQVVAVKEVITTPSGKIILDFGQNLVGWCRFNCAPSGCNGGDEIVLRHAEVLEDGELGVRPLRVAKCTDTIVCSNDTSTLEGWQPKFTFHGFRYAEVTGWPNITKDDISAVVLHTDLERTGFFECSHPQINKLHENVVWGWRGNSLSVPTDCPQRDERLGWTGDLQVFAPTASFLFDTAGFLGGWLKDVAVEQLLEEGGIPPIVVPNVLQHVPFQSPMAVWDDVTALTPWDLHTAFGDKQVLLDQYESMTVWLDKGVKRDDNSLYASELIQLGDWLDPKAPPEDPADCGTDSHLVANAYLVHVTKIVSQVAEMLGRSADAKRYAADSGRLKGEFQKEYISSSGRMVSDSQTALALAIHFDLFENDSQRRHAANRLAFLVTREKFKVAAGFAGE